MIVTEQLHPGAALMRIVSIADVAALVRGRRMDLGLSQGDLARRAKVSRKWINEFEAGGKATAELGHVLRVLEALDVDLEAVTGGRRPTSGGIDLDDILSDLRRG
jgi:transcriptional regulator with XRE-family HTH domain